MKPTLVFTAALVVGALLLLPSSSSACSMCLCPDGSWVWNCDDCFEGSPLVGLETTSVIPLDDDRVLIAIPGFLTEEMDGGSCSVAFPEVPGIQGINRINLFEAATGNPVEEMLFQPNARAGQDYSRLAAETYGPAFARHPWAGFLAEQGRGMEGPVETVFVVDVTLAKGTTLQQLVATLRTQGILLGGSSHHDGALDGHHQFLRRLGSGDIQVIYPAQRPTPNGGEGVPRK